MLLDDLPGPPNVSHSRKDSFPGFGLSDLWPGLLSEDQQVKEI